MDLELPEKAAAPLFAPARYKVLYGGRGSGKSWAAARALLAHAKARRLRILCTREVQKSIKDSVHKLLADQIQALHLGSIYDVQRDVIRGRNGSEFLFAGLSDQTAESIKSFEGVDICWCEEAQAISEQSWRILTPTIRAPGSEIWVTFNPELDSDPTYQRFVVDPPPDALVVQLNYSDNPWFPGVLEQERQRDQKLLPADDYAMIWEGKCRSAVIGAIYAGEVDAAIRSGRIGAVPYDPRLRVHAVWDLGWADSTAIVCAQRLRSEIRIIDYIEDTQRSLDWYAGELTARRWNWGYDWLPHDADHRSLQTGKSAAEVLRAFGRRTRPVPNVSVEDGIRAGRIAFAQAYFDRARADRLIECLKRYRRNINRHNEPANPVHDQYSHGADAWRYLALVAERMANDADARAPRTQAWQPLDPTMGY